MATPAGMPSMGKTGNASIARLGQTKVNRHGRDPHVKVGGNFKATDERNGK